MAEAKVLYLVAKRHSIVQKTQVVLEDIARMECADERVLEQVKRIPLHSFSVRKNENQMEFFSVLKVIERIHGKFPSLVIESLGENDFVVEYKGKEKEKDWVDICKLAALCIIIFFGSAFTIMAFNNDISITGVFDRFYLQVMGIKKPAVTELEITYSLGITIGILVFFNHVGKRKFSSDPTPIQVEVNKYQSDIDDTVIENAGQKGHEQDVS